MIDWLWSKRVGARMVWAVSGMLLMGLGGVEAQQARDLSAFVGRWQIDLSRTQMNRGNIVARAATFTFVFEPASEGLTMQTYAEYPQAAPTRINPIVPDGKPRTCTTGAGCLTVGGNAAEQSYAYHQIDAHMLMRVFYIKGEPVEYTSYAVSNDGKTFTMIAWGAEAPERQNRQVFVRQPEARLQPTGLYRPGSVEAFYAAVDTNHDGMASEAEWKAAGLKMDSFLAIQWFNDTISRQRMEHHPFPPSALDVGGNLTVAGMKSYDEALNGFGEVFVHPKSVVKLMGTLDSNRDGKIVSEEWQNGGLNGFIFANLDKNSQGKGYLMAEDILAGSYTDSMMEPDGSLTVESIKAYDARRHPGTADNQR